MPQQTSDVTQPCPKCGGEMKQGFIVDNSHVAQFRQPLGTRPTAELVLDRHQAARRLAADRSVSLRIRAVSWSPTPGQNSATE